MNLVSSISPDGSTVKKGRAVLLTNGEPLPTQPNQANSLIRNAPISVEKKTKADFAVLTAIAQQ